MAQIWGKNEANYLMVTRAYIPSKEQALSAWPSSPTFLRERDLQVENREHAIALVATALGRLSTYHQRGLIDGGLKKAMILPLETWVIEPSLNEDSVFTQFFEYEPQNTDLRLLIHQNPIVGRSPDFWRGVYRNKKFGLKRKNGPYKHLQESISPFLEEMLSAYQQDDQAVHELMQSTEHPYKNAKWVPSCYS